MSLVGSSVNIIPEDSLPPPMGVESTESFEDGDNTTILHDMVTAYQDGDDAHPPPTPPGAAEALFLSGLPTHTISATALAEQIHARHRPLSWHGGGTSIATDDFVSATDALHNSSLLVEHDDTDDHQYDIDNDEQPFGNDALIHTRDALIIDPDDTNMAAKTTTTTATTTPSTVPKTKSSDMHVDPAEKIYGTAKGVWGWGKGIFLFSPFLGLAEGIAGKIVQTAGSNLEDLDTAVLEKLHGLDDGVLNPAITAIVGTLLSAKGKTEDIVGPILEKLLKPLGLLKDKPEAESNLKPDGTTVVAK